MRNRLVKGAKKLVAAVAAFAMLSATVFAGAGSTYAAAEKDNDGSACGQETEVAAYSQTESTPLADHGKLHVDSSTLKLTDSHGNPFTLRGVSTHGINWDVGYPFIDKDAFRFARDTLGANAVRLACYTTEYYGYADPGQATQWESADQIRKTLEQRIDNGVNYASGLGMYCIIDWHVLNDANPLKYQSYAESFFTKMAQKYKDKTNVIYEICNEPCNGTTWNDIKTYARKIIPIIRKYDSDAIIIVGTPNWSQDVDVVAGSPLKNSDIGGSGSALATNVMYTIHFYAATHGDDYINKVKAANGKIPMMCTEFGVSAADGNGGLNTSMGARWLDYFDSVGISYFMWSFSGKNESSAMFYSGTTLPLSTSKLSEAGRWLMNQYTTRNKNTVKNGLYKENGVWYYYVNDKIATNVSGLIKTNGAWYVIEKGIMQQNYNGLYRHTSGSWYYIVSGRMQDKFEGLVKHNGSFWYIKGGKLRSTYKGMAKHTSGAWYYIEKGKAMTGYTGLARHSTGVWYYVVKGKMNSSFAGIVKYGNSSFYVKGGRMQSGFTGKITLNGKTYNISKGKVIG